MRLTHLLPAAAVAMFAASCANQSNAPYDTYAYDDFGTPDGVPYQPVNPVYDSPPAFEETRPATPPARPPAPARQDIRHTVVRGDTLWGLQQKYGVSIAEIKRANNMTSDTVVLGRTLTIPAR